MAETLAVVVFSGGLDSTTALVEAIEDHGHNNVIALTFGYGQKHKVEIDCARDITTHFMVGHRIINMNADLFVGGSLTSDEEIVDMRYDDLPTGQMSPTYVPFRNGNLLSQAVAFADNKIRAYPDSWNEALVYAGMHAEDAAGFAYADCTPEFLGAMAAAIYVGTYGKVRLHCLYQHLTKAEIIGRGTIFDVPYEMTHSCYRGERPACGRCSTCQARKEAFAIAGRSDPLEYALEV